MLYNKQLIYNYITDLKKDKEICTFFLHRFTAISILAVAHMMQENEETVRENIISVKNKMKEDNDYKEMMYKLVDGLVDYADKRTPLEKEYRHIAGRRKDDKTRT